MIDNIDQDVETTLVDDTQRRMNEEDMFGVNDLDGDKVVVDVSASEKVEQSVKVVGKETLIEIKVAKPKAITTAAKTVTTTGTRPKKKEIVMLEPFETPLPKPIISSQKPLQAKDKGKEKMVEPERHLKRKYHIMMDAEVVKNLEAQMQAELKKEERLARQKEEKANIALVAEWDNTQAMMDADCELVARLQEEEREELTIEEKSRLFVELMDKRHACQGISEAKVRPLSGKDPLVIVVADTERISRMCCGSALSAYALKHPSRNQLISGHSGSS
nr:hypothetical protein [Tanacetum cinerariifolium]